MDVDFAHAVALGELANGQHRSHAGDALQVLCPREFAQAVRDAVDTDGICAFGSTKHRDRRGEPPAALLLVHSLASLRQLGFGDRGAAGRALARELLHYAETGAIVLALPRGGVPVADEIARAIGATLEILVVRTLGVPWQPQLAMGAIAEGGDPELERGILRAFDVTPSELREAIACERVEVGRRTAIYRGDHCMPDLRGRTVIVVDDGSSTGVAIRAALHAARHRGAARIVLAMPITSPAVLATVQADADEIVCPVRPLELRAIGDWPEDPGQVTDAEILAILHRARQLAA
jgi:putative phosphoribosyl transferase